MDWNPPLSVIPHLSFPRWYGLLFGLGILLGLKVSRGLLRPVIDSDDKFYGGFLDVLIGMIVGMRLFHCLFYSFGYYVARPWEILFVWHGGFSSHGGILGVVAGVWFFKRKNPQFSLLRIMDGSLVGCTFVAIFIRIGNFVNSEILGTPTLAPWGVIFSRIDQVPRHPVQLYEAIGYVVLAFITKNMFTKQWFWSTPGRISGIIFICAPLWRSYCEFFKESLGSGDTFLQQSLHLNTGQLLSIPFVLVGIW